MPQMWVKQGESLRHTMPPMAPGSQAIRLLLADDDPKLRQFLELELGDEGYTVQSTASGMEALLAIRQAKPELVILDWMLPDLSGVEVCRRCTENLHLEAQTNFSKSAHQLGRRDYCAEERALLARDQINRQG